MIVLSKGQAAIFGLVVMVILLIMFIGLFPVLDDLIASALPIADDLTAALLRLFLPLAGIAVLYSFVKYVVPQGQSGF